MKNAIKFSVSIDQQTEQVLIEKMEHSGITNRSAFIKALINNIELKFTPKVTRQRIHQDLELDKKEIDNLKIHNKYLTESNDDLTKTNRLFMTTIMEQKTRIQKLESYIYELKKQTNQKPMQNSIINGLEQKPIKRKRRNRDRRKVIAEILPPGILNHFKFDK